MVSLHENEGTWGVAAYLTLMNQALTPASVLPFVYCNFKVVNHVKDDKSVEQGALPLTENACKPAVCYTRRELCLFYRTILGCKAPVLLLGNVSLLLRVNR